MYYSINHMKFNYHITQVDKCKQSSNTTALEQRQCVHLPKSPQSSLLYFTLLLLYYLYVWNTFVLMCHCLFKQYSVQITWRIERIISIKCEHWITFYEQKEKKEKTFNDSNISFLFQNKFNHLRFPSKRGMWGSIPM